MAIDRDLLGLHNELCHSVLRLAVEHRELRGELKTLRQEIAELREVRQQLRQKPGMYRVGPEPLTD